MSTIILQNAPSAAVSAAVSAATRGNAVTPARACGRRSHHTRRYLQVLMQVSAHEDPDAFRRLRSKAIERTRCARRQVMLRTQGLPLAQW
jgi:hypothetical protein